MEIPIRKIELANPLTEGERGALRTVGGHEVRLSARTDIVKEGDAPGFTTVLLEGLVFRHKTPADGHRQIMAFHVPGDWPDLHSYFLPRMDHSLTAMTDCRVAQIPHPRLRQLIEEHPRLGQLLWRETMVDSTIFREWVVNLGSRDAFKRTAHLFCELREKMVAVGVSDGSSLELPMTQADLADTVGVSVVHMNRTLQSLRAEGAISLSRGRLQIPDWERLKQMGGFDPAYLHIDSEMPVIEALLPEKHGG